MNANRTLRIAWFSDADNTLWDTDGVFRAAQLGLLDDVEAIVNAKCNVADRLAYVRKIDQGIANKHHRGLRYPVELLVNAIGHILRNGSNDAAVAFGLTGRPILPPDESTNVVTRFHSALGLNPDLRPGVRQGLATLLDRGLPVTVVTEGHKDRIAHLLDHHALKAYVTDVVEATKTKELFLRLTRLYPTSQCWMIGDQVDRDIEIARLAGMNPVYFPGGFFPSWSQAVDTTVLQVDSYDQGVQLALRREVNDGLNRVAQLR